MNREAGRKEDSMLISWKHYVCIVHFAYNEEVKDYKRISAQLLCAADKYLQHMYLDLSLYLDPPSTNKWIHFFFTSTRNPRFDSEDPDLR